MLGNCNKPRFLYNYSWLVINREIIVSTNDFFDVLIVFSITLLANLLQDKLQKLSSNILRTLVSNYLVLLTIYCII